MIDNYLDWVKWQRKYSVKMAVLHGRRNREVVDDWSKGFYKGLAMAYDYAGRNFKKLQKDIEATLKTVAKIYAPACTDLILNKFDF